MAFRNGTNLILIIAVTNFLGQDAAGEFLYALSFSMVLALVVDYSFNINVPLIVQDEPKRVYNSLLLKVLLAFFSIGVLFVILSLNLYPYDKTTLLLVYFSVMLNSFTNFSFLIFRGKGKFLQESYMIIKNNSILLICSLVTLYFSTSLIALSIAYAVSRILGFIVVSYNTNDFFKKNIDSFAIKNLFFELKSGFAFALLVAIGYLYVSVDTIALGYVVKSSDVALYQILLQMALALCLTSNTLSQLYIVKFNKKRKLGALSISYVYRVLVYSLLVGGVISLVYYLISPIIMNFIYNIHDYRMQEILIFLALVITLRHGIGILGSFITVCGTNTYRIFSTLAGLVFLLAGLFYYNSNLTVELSAKLLFFSHIVIFLLMAFSAFFVRKMKLYA